MDRAANPAGGLRIGLTGGIACGKSTVSKMLEAMGARRIDADELAHRLLTPGQDSFRRVAELWPRVVTPQGTIDRRLLGEIVFADDGARRVLEGIVHPAVQDLMLQEMAVAGKQAAVAEVPLLFEVGLERWFHQVWAVTATDVQQRERLAAQGLSPEQVRRRLAAQLPTAEKARRADAVIDNSGDLEHTRVQVERLWAEAMGNN